MYIEKDLVRSKAWLALGGVAPQVYMIFRTKCQMGREKWDQNWSITNNGQIYFPYTEAQKTYGITAPRFRRAIDDLIDKGMIDIEDGTLSKLIRNAIASAARGNETDVVIQNLSDALKFIELPEEMR
jgi:hypothetical protein